MARPPRVLGVIAASIPGGAEAVFLTLLRGLAGQVEPYVVCDPSGPMVEHFRAAAVDLAEVALDSPTRVRATPAIARLVDRWAIDLVHTHLWNADLLGGLAAVWRRRPLVSTVHGRTFQTAGTQGLHKLRRQALSRIYRSVYRLCDRIIVPSQALADELPREAGIRAPGQRITVVPNGLDFDLLDARLATSSLPPSLAERLPAPLVVCVGNMVAVKGHEALVRALPAVCAAVPDVVIALVGEGELRSRIARQVRDLGLVDRVVFTGSLENPLAVVQRADVCVVPSLFEGLGVVVIEAMALGRAVVASRVGGIPEVVRSEQAGLLVPPGDVRALSAALTRLLRDEGLRRRIGTAAREDVRRHWSAERMIRGTAAVYEEVLAARSSANH